MLITILSLSLGFQFPPPQEPTSPQPPASSPQEFKPDAGWKSLGKDLWFDPAKRRVIFRAKVCLREGILEHLLCTTNSKEHESILSTDAPPRLIHAGLILAAGEPGHPVRFRPEVEPPTGPKIRIELQWLDSRGVLQTCEARNWVKDEKTGQSLETHWVFAGSELFQDPDTKKVIYAADAGDLFTVANFPAAILDLPIVSSNSDAERSFVAFADRIPPLRTFVTIILSPLEPQTSKPQP